jgi:short-subunit dehydrogenase
MLALIMPLIGFAIPNKPPLPNRVASSPKQAERSRNMRAAVDKERFGPWALVTGASSGIGKEFARQIAAAGINVVLVARREAVLHEVGRSIAADFKVDYRALAMDLSQEGFLERLTRDTNDLDIGLVVSNAGTGNSGEFLKLDRQLLQKTLRLSTMAHLDITHHFGAKLAERRRGGLILIGSMGAEIGVPFMANDGAAKAYVHSLGEALHYEFKPRGVYVTVVPPPLTNTPVLAKLGFDPRTMPMKPMSVEQCVSEGLNALRVNRSRIIPGRLNRIMKALMPASVKRTMTAKLIGKALARKPAPANARAEA